MYNASASDSTEYLQYLEFTPIALFIECDGKVVAVNRATLDFFGAIESSELVGKSVLSLVHTDHHSKLTERLQQVHNGRNSPPIEELMLRADGMTVFAELGATPFLY